MFVVFYNSNISIFFSVKAVSGIFAISGLALYMLLIIAYRSGQGH
jgi:hypothetical protein